VVLSVTLRDYAHKRTLARGWGDSLRKKKRLKLTELDSLHLEIEEDKKATLALRFQILNELVLSEVPLTNKEKELWDCIFLCMKPKDIAGKLNASPGSIRTQKSMLIGKIRKHVTYERFLEVD